MLDTRLSSLTCYAVLLAVTLLLYLPGVTSLPVTDRDAARFAQASKQMLETGQYQQIRFQHQLRHKKPPGIYWLHVGLHKLLPTHALNTIGPYRFASLLGALCAVLLCFALSQSLIGKRNAFMGSLLLATCLLLNVEAHIVTTDAVLLATIILMQLSLWHCYTDYCQHKKSSFTPLFWLGLNLGILIKGISPLIALMTLISLCLQDRNIRFLKTLKPLYGILLTLLIHSSWLLLLSFYSQHNFLVDMVGGDLLPKLTGGHESHGAPPGYYLIIMLIGFWPASIFLLLTAYFAWQQRKNQSVKFLTAWFLPNYLLLALVPTKLPQYILPLFPALSLLSALAISKNVIRRWPISLNYVLWLIISVLMGASVVIIAYQFSAPLTLPLLLMGLLIAGASFIIHAAFTQKFTQAVYGMVLACLLAFPLVFQWQAPQLKSLWLTEKIYQAVTEQPENYPLYSTAYQEPSLVFRLGTHRVVFADRAETIKAIKEKQRGYVLIDEANYTNWLHHVKDVHLHLQKLASIRGFHYSKGKWMQLSLLEITA